MKTLLKQIEIDRTLDNDKIEATLSNFGEPLRWSVVKADEKKIHNRSSIY